MRDGHRYCYKCCRFLESDEEARWCQFRGHHVAEEAEKEAGY